MATATFFGVAQSQVIKCGRCGAPIFWQNGRHGSRYPTDVLVDKGQPVSSRTNFHKCDQAARDAFEKRQLEAAGQQSFAPKMNMAGVHGLFDKAIASGLKYPKIRLLTPAGQAVALARAGDKSRCKGQIMVTDGEKFGQNKYFGRVDQMGIYHPTPISTEEVRTLLEQLGADPAKVAAGYGKLTGNCCFCMRRLDDDRSTAVGYGPICANKFGLPWG